MTRIGAVGQEPTLAEALESYHSVPVSAFRRTATTSSEEIARLGQDEFSRRYSASSRSLFNRSNPNNIFWHQQIRDDHSISRTPARQELAPVDRPLRESASLGALGRVEIPWWQRREAPGDRSAATERLERVDRSAVTERPEHMERREAPVDRSAATEYAVRVKKCVGNLIKCCGVCQTDQPMVALVPCGHVLCSDCLTNSCHRYRCPFCRGSVEKSVVLFEP